MRLNHGPIPVVSSPPVCHYPSVVIRSYPSPGLEGASVTDAHLRLCDHRQRHCRALHGPAGPAPRQRSHPYKGSIDDCNTKHAQGGIAAAIGEGDTPDLHFWDTVVAGAGLSNRDAVRTLVTEAADRIADLIEMGVPFDTVDGEVALAKEAAHAMPVFCMPAEMPPASISRSRWAGT